ncbi:MAG TPA: hypothetical protein VKX16_04170 [Chloroflexota bacterium]|nr:hypothetical protein [Chloroflexota bacterium]
MNAAIWVIVAVVVIVVLALGVWQYMQRRRDQEVRQQFGPVYDRTVEQYGGDERKANAVLAERKDELEKVTVHHLSADERQQYTDRWQSIQAQFVDDPGGAVERADTLIGEAMQTIGFPVDGSRAREEAVAVKYPEAAGDYQQAHDIADRQRNGDASTEDLRQAMVLYRSLFQRLVGMPVTSQTEVTQ